jgi:glucose-1-phosphate adenylyltransferase
MEAMPDLSRTVAFLLAGGEGRRLHELTERQCKPALHFLSAHRIVDFSVAAALRANIPHIFVATQFCPATLARHLQSVWGPASGPGTVSGLLGPDVAGPAGYAGTADALRANGPMLDELEAREVVVLPGDQVHAVDLRGLIGAHRAAGAKLTVAMASVAPVAPPGMPAPDGGAVETTPTGVCVADWGWLQRLLSDGRADFEADVLAPAMQAGEVASWIWEGYWRDVNSLDDLRRSWLDFEARPLPCPRPLAPGMSLTLPPSAPDGFAGRINTGDVRLYSPLVGGHDRDRWAVLDRSILMPGSRIAPGVRLTRVIVAPGTAIPEGMSIGLDRAEDARWFRIDGETTLVTPQMLAHRAMTLGASIPAIRRSRGTQPRP